MREFDIIQKLGSGSFGTVFKVQRKVDDQVYVVKTVRIAELPYQEQVDAINEVRLLAQMDCLYIVKYYDSFIEDENLNIVMEFCNKGDLQSLLKKAKDKNIGKDVGSVTYGLRENVG
jgi:NIMA (never in mitosis gene a)-related kinase 1/4/5